MLISDLEKEEIPSSHSYSIFLCVMHLLFLITVDLVGSEVTKITIRTSLETLAAHLDLAAVRSDQEVLVLHLAQETLEVRSVQGITTTICNRVERARSRVSQTLSSEASVGHFLVI